MCFKIIRLNLSSELLRLTFFWCLTYGRLHSNKMLVSEILFKRKN